MSRIAAIAPLGQQIWLDNLTRQLLDSGELARWIADDAIAGVTSNPAIFYNAIRNDLAYQSALAKLKTTAVDAEKRFESLVLPDIRKACDLLAATHAQSGGSAGFVSFEVSPTLASDAAGTLAAARRLWAEIDRPNAMIKIPATPAGIEAISDAIADGINVNVTLIFSPQQLAAVQGAYRAGIERRFSAGFPVDRINSVASVFISRVDSLLDPRLPAALQGKTAIAFAAAAYGEWQSLPPLPGGARQQMLLWASTSTKNAAYRDVIYVEELISRGTVNTVPDATLAAFRDHGEAAERLSGHVTDAAAQLATVAAAGVDLEAAGQELLDAGLKQFEEAFAKLLALVA
ncbi:transaldolase [Dechloromonas sp.]|uniref:transaldolase n=1 Tax=Dechloromonas sp. TaxID=1917218 RepID=UPI0012199F88|nr:transaldolase [Dechloromonas sp.]MBU3695894.1 transaldolase [Dechloromonas sp.]TEX48076.1 MAG: transaldolase [Rhodocyclaceae bacterium]